MDPRKNFWQQGTTPDKRQDTQLVRGKKLTKSEPGQKKKEPSTTPFDIIFLDTLIRCYIEIL